MSLRDWLKLVVLILLPINAWLCLFYYQKWLWVRMYFEGERRDQLMDPLRHQYFLERRWLIKEGHPLLRLPYLTQVFGKYPPLGQGVPVLFLYISWCAEPEVWELAIEEALKTDLNLHIALMYDLPTTFKDGKEIVDTKRLLLARQLWEKFNKQFETDRISVLISRDWWKVWGNMRSGTLAVVCDGQGIVRVIEPYPPLRFSAFWHEEVADWRPKLHQAVKRALEKFFGKPSEAKGR